MSETTKWTFGSCLARVRNYVRAPTMRMRIAFGLMILLLVLFAALWGVLAERALRGLNGSLDDSLKTVAELAARDASLWPAAGAGPESAPAKLSWPAGWQETFFEARSLSDGAVLARSPSLRDGEDLFGPFSWKLVRKQAGSRGWNCSVGSDRLRCIALKVDLALHGESGAGKPVLLIVGTERDQADRRFNEIVIRSGAGLCLALLFAVAGVWFVVWRATRPLAGLAEDVIKIRPDNIRPVRVPEDPELGLLAQRLNYSLESVARSIDREKRFSSDVAHELLTPIGGLRAEIEVALRKPRPAEELRLTVERCGLMVREIQGLVENLLELGRLERGTSAVSWEEVDLRDSLDAIWSAVGNAAGGRGVSFENQTPDGMRVSVCVSLFEIVVKNLLSNVARYARQGSRAWAECRNESGRVVLSICNEAENLPQDFAENAFERFWRSDPSRTRGAAEAGTGIGLGLPLARTAAQAFGSDVTLEIRDGRIVSFSMPIAISLAFSSQGR